jgi:hypothetical protein
MFRVRVLQLNQGARAGPALALGVLVLLTAHLATAAVLCAALGLPGATMSDAHQLINSGGHRPLDARLGALWR